MDKKVISIFSVMLLSLSLDVEADLTPESLKTQVNEPAVASPSAIPPTSSKKILVGNVTFDQVQTLRKEGKLREARELATNHLATNPKDVDVRLLLGLIYMTQKQYTQAETQFNMILAQTPTYTEARDYLAQVKIAQQQLKSGEKLVVKEVKKDPENKSKHTLKKQIVSAETKHSVKKTAKHHKKHRHLSSPISPEKRELMLYRQYLNNRDYSKALPMIKRLIQMYPDNVNYRIALADYYLVRHHDMKALSIIRLELVRHPNNIALLNKKGEINQLMHQYPVAAQTYEQVIALDPSNKYAKNGLSEISEITPNYLYGLNEIGVATDNAYVSGLHSIWNYTGVYYSRDTNYGRISARINSASRQHMSAPQYGLDFSPRVNRNIYFDLSAAYSDNPAIFPNRMASAEGYMNVPGLFELSAGGKYSKIDQTYLETYTGSINLYPGNYWVSFRPYYFVPKNHTEQSSLYTLKIRRYFATIDHYIGLTVGAGTSPDLADLRTVNFIKINNKLVGLNYEFPILNHHIIVDLGIGYNRWEYPSGLVRELGDGSIGFKYRF